MSRIIPVMDAVVSQSEDTGVWEVKARLTDIADYVGVREGDEVILNIGGEEYTLIVTGKSLNRSAPANVDVQLSAKSALVFLDAPYASQMEFRNDTPITAREAVESIIGVPVTNWEIVDWVLPIGRIAFEGVTPLVAVRRLVGAAGAIVLAEKNGDITVRSLYPVPMDDLLTVTVDHTFTDSEDTLSVSEEHEVQPDYNLFRISEGDSTFADKLEYVPTFIPDGGTDSKGNPTGSDSPDSGTLYVLPSPWRSTYRLINTQSPNTTAIQATGETEREFEELVQFSGGSAGVAHPVSSVISVAWMSASLGGVAFEDGSTSLSASTAVNQGYGLATVKYRSKAFAYAVTGVRGTSALVLMEDTTGE